MEQWSIRRVSNTEHGCFGLLIDPEGLPFAATLERPHHSNRPFIDAMPEGIYICIKIVSPKNGVVFEITGVPGRTEMQIHRANLIQDIEGCVALGVCHGYTKNTRGDYGFGVQQSGFAFTKFMERMKNLDKFMLRVINCF